MQPSEPISLYNKVYEALGKRFSKGLFSQSINAKQFRPTLHAATILAFLIAGITHAVTLGFLVLGLLLLRGAVLTLSSSGLSSLLAFGLATLCLGIVWLLRPRVLRLTEPVLPRDKYPALYEFADRVAHALQAHPVDGILIDASFSAAIIIVGLRRKRILVLGLPLLSILSRQERVGLVAHEIAHSINGDLNRLFFIGAAITSLATWYDLLYPRGAGSSIVLWIVDAVQHLLASVPRLGLYALIHLLWRDSQRAEYWADYLGATMSGTDAALSLLDKLHFSRAFEIAAQHVHAGWEHVDFFDELRREVSSMPPRELERIRRVERLEGSRLDATHPPTAYRIEFLQAYRVTDAKLVLTSGDNDRIDRELATLRDQIQNHFTSLRRRRSPIQNPRAKPQNPT